MIVQTKPTPPDDQSMTVPSELPLGLRLRRVAVQTLELRLNYDPRRFAAEDAARILDTLRHKGHAALPAHRRCVQCPKRERADR